MDRLGLNEIRERYLRYFESKGHVRLKSFPLIPQEDKGLLIINSGMAPMKPYFSGEAVPPGKRVTTCQKCVRTNDIDNVGRTSRHGTFFEMLGNFSFGDYFKREAIKWAWEFLTEEMKLPKEKLYISVYLDDDEAYGIWTEEIGIAESHMTRLGKEDNFWEIGAGPCGPSSEIHYDRGADTGCGKPECAVGCDCDRFIEIWNLVFTQFNNDGEGNYTTLTQKNIDTGMGLERIGCIVQGVKSLFEVDTVMNITRHVSALTGVEYGQGESSDMSLRIITDHIRSAVMMIGDGIIPSNEGRGYVLRRLLRRAAMRGRMLGRTEPFLNEVCLTAINESGKAYPELMEKQEYVVRVIKAEEERFNLTIDSGMSKINGLISEMKSAGRKQLEGKEAFKLYDTYGFPIDLTREILEENGMTADMQLFAEYMEEQRNRAREATAALGDYGWESLDLGLPKDETTEFTGYDRLSDDARIVALVSDGELSETLRESQDGIVILDTTPFYAEMGGQTADTGTLTVGGSIFEVVSVHRSKDGKYLHSGRVRTGEIRVWDSVKAEIDTERRRAIMRAHSATHLLQAALKRILGVHVEQAGSLVLPDAVRFDFTHFTALTPEELADTAALINEQILAGLQIETREMAYDEAKKEGATALFGEKYGSTVRVVRMGDYSIELCGGTHLDNTSKIGSFIVSSEFSVAAGVRRIEAVVGKKALDTVNEANALNKAVAEALKTTPNEILTRITHSISENKEQKRIIDKLRGKVIKYEIEHLARSVRDIADYKLLTVNLGDVDTEWLRTAGSLLRDKSDNMIAVLVAENNDKLVLHAVCGKGAVKDGIRAGDIIKLVSKITGGSGGGKPDSAMGGGKDAKLLGNAFTELESYIITAHANKIK